MRAVLLSDVVPVDVLHLQSMFVMSQGDSQSDVEQSGLSSTKHQNTKHRKSFHAAADLQAKSRKKSKGHHANEHAAAEAAYETKERLPLQEVELSQRQESSADDAPQQLPQPFGRGASDRMKHAAAPSVAANGPTAAGGNSNCRQDAEEGRANLPGIRADGEDNCAGAAGVGPKRLLTDTFASLTHVRQYALEASKAIDRLRNKSPVQNKRWTRNATRATAGTTGDVRSATLRGCSHRQQSPPQV